MNQPLVLVALFCASLSHHPTIGTQGALEENLAAGTSFHFKDDIDNESDRLRRSGDRYSGPPQPAYGYQPPYMAYPSYGQPPYASPPYSPQYTPAYGGNMYQTYRNPGYQGTYGGDYDYASATQYRAQTPQYRAQAYRPGGYSYQQTPYYGGPYMGRSDLDEDEDEEGEGEDAEDHWHGCRGCSRKPRKCRRKRRCRKHHCCSRE